MRVVVQPPRRSEAESQFVKNEEMIVTPRFYAKLGMPTVAHFEVVDTSGKSCGRYIVKTNEKGDLRMTKLVEIVPLCDGGDGTMVEEDIG